MVSPARRPNYRFGLAEACWILAGSDDAELIGRFNRHMLKFSDDGRTMWGAYGPRLMGQLAHVISSLRRDPASRQAVVTTWRPMVEAAYSPNGDDAMRAAGMVHYPGDVDVPEWDGSSWRSKDVPCTVAWHFQLRHEKLQLTVFMRSNDIWLGLPYDLLSFTTVQRVVASMLGVEPGPYHHITSNLHLYETNFEAAHEVLLEPRGTAAAISETRFVLPAFGDLFIDGRPNNAAMMFDQIVNRSGGLPQGRLRLSPFLAACWRQPELWPPYLDLMRANGRGRTAGP
jgi:thymidylate synthase